MTPPPAGLNVVGGIYREQSGPGAVHGAQADLGVDVEQALDAAGGPDGGLDAELVRLEVVVVVGAADGEGG